MARVRYLFFGYLLLACGSAFAGDPSPAPTKESVIRAWQLRIDGFKGGTHVSFSQEWDSHCRVELWGTKSGKVRVEFSPSETRENKPKDRRITLIWNFPDFHMFQDLDNKDRQVSHHTLIAPEDVPKAPEGFF